MGHLLSEDDIYRASTQYRLWSFSPESLAAQRKKTHDLAVERAKRYAGPRAVEHGTFDLLTETEELRLVQRYAEQIRSTSDHFKWPVNVKATAVQYLRRFYLSNSCITYPPKEIYKTVLFLACKSEATHMTLSEYARRISTDPEAVLAAEYKVMQALRFTLDVKQPFRGLKGCLMELLNMAEGMVGSVEGIEEEMANGTVVKDRIIQLPFPGETDKTKWTPPSSGIVQSKYVQDRIQTAYSTARALLDGPASLTDAYFLYTPSQMLFAALQVADGPLTSFYLSTKLPIASETRTRILATISSCADMLSAFDKSQVLTKDERASLEEKLEKCRDPATRDLVKAFAALRQDGSGEDGLSDEKAKKRQMAREKNQTEGQDLFGPALTTNGT